MKFSSAYLALSTLTAFGNPNHSHSKELQTSVLCKLVPRLKRGEDGAQAHLTGQIDGSKKNKDILMRRPLPTLTVGVRDWLWPLAKGCETAAALL